jgi:hypothetical protein
MSSKPQLSADVRRLLRANSSPVCSCVIVNDQAVIIVKLDRAKITGLRQSVPIGYWLAAGFYPTGAVIRLTISFFDQPGDPIDVATFLNPADDSDLHLLHRLEAQAVIVIHLFEDTANDYVISKEIDQPETSRSELRALIDRAIQHNATLVRLDFAAAQAAMRRGRPLDT